MSVVESWATLFVLAVFAGAGAVLLAGFTGVVSAWIKRRGE